MLTSLLSLILQICHTEIQHDFPANVSISGLREDTRDRYEGQIRGKIQTCDFQPIITHLANVPLTCWPITLSDTVTFPRWLTEESILEANYDRIA